MVPVVFALVEDVAYTAVDSNEASSAIEALTRKYPQYVGDSPPGAVLAVRLTRWRSWEATPAP